MAAQREEALLSCILDMGVLLLTSGAEVMRVEDTVTRLCKAYGFQNIHIFAITSSIVLTVRTQEGHLLTLTRRVRRRGTDLGDVERINALSRSLCEKPLPVNALSKKIDEVRPHATPWLQRLVTYALVSSVFSGFFGGTAADAVAAAGSGACLFGALLATQQLRLNEMFSSFACSALTAAAAAALVRCGLGQHLDKIMIGNIMLMIPGLAFTASLRDMISGDTISGLLGLCEAALKALGIAAGIAASLWIFGG